MPRWWSLVTLSLALLARLPATAMAAEPSSPGEGPSVETVSVSTGSALALPDPSLEPEVLAARGIGSPRPGHRARAIPVLSAERARILLRSLTVPGWGQATAGRPTAARVFGIAELGVWATFAGFRIQEQMRRESYERTARILAGIDLRGRDDEFRRIVGAYISSDEYNQLVVFRDAANLFYDPKSSIYLDPEGYRRYIAEHELRGSDSWSWDGEGSLLRYRGQRKDAQRASLRANTALALAIIDRLLSAVDAGRAANRAPRSKRSWNLEVTPSDENDATAFRLGVRTRF